MALAFVGFFNNTQASTLLSIKLPGDTTAYTTTVGSFFDAYIYADALPNFGGFDFNLTYDSSKMSALTLTSASIFGAGTDTEIFGNTISTNVATHTGTVHFGETISGTSPLNELGVGVDINAPTLLGTLHFQALAVGANSFLNITNPPLLFDFNAASLIKPGDTLQPAGVTINVAAVPLPGSALFIASGLLTVFGLRKSNAKQLI